MPPSGSLLDIPLTDGEGHSEENNEIEANDTAYQNKINNWWDTLVLATGRGKSQMN